MCHFSSLVIQRIPRQPHAIDVALRSIRRQELFLSIPVKSTDENPRRHGIIKLLPPRRQFHIVPFIKNILITDYAPPSADFSHKSSRLCNLIFSKVMSVQLPVISYKVHPAFMIHHLRIRIIPEALIIESVVTCLKPGRLPCMRLLEICGVL